MEERFGNRLDRQRPRRVPPSSRRRLEQQRQLVLSLVLPSLYLPQGHTGRRRCDTGCILTQARPVQNSDRWPTARSMKVTRDVVFQAWIKHGKGEVELTLGGEVSGIKVCGLHVPEVSDLYLLG